MGLEVKSSDVIREKTSLLLGGKCTQLRASLEGHGPSGSGCSLPADDSREAALLSIALGGKYSSLRMCSREIDAALLFHREKNKP